MNLTAPSTPVPDSPLLDELKIACAQMARTEGTHLHNTFPGMQPISLTRAVLKSLSNEFMVCEKTDGVRFLLLAWKFTIYLVDRRFAFYPINVPWPPVSGEYTLTPHSPPCFLI